MSLESEKMGLESECGSLHGRLNSKTEECQQIQQTLGQKSIDLEEALANLGKASETFASLEQKNSSDSGHFEVCIKGSFYSESAIRFSNLQKKICQITILSLKFEFVVYCYWREI